MKAFSTCQATLGVSALLALGLHEAAPAQVRIASLPAASALTGSELIPAVQGGADVVTTPAAIRTYAGVGAGGSPGGSSGQLQFNNAGAFGGFTLAGDCTITAPTITCSKTGGASFGPLATAAALPSPGASSLGGVESLAAVPHQWINAISTAGTPLAAQPACGDLSDATLCNAAYPGAGIAGSTGSAWAASYATTGSGSVLALATSPSFTTPALGAATAASINGDTLTTGSFTLTGAAGKTLTFNNSLTLAGTDSTTMTFPATSSTVLTQATLGTVTGSVTFGTGAVANFNGPSSYLEIGSNKLLAPVTPSCSASCAISSSAGSAEIEATISATLATTVVTPGFTASHKLFCQGRDMTTGLNGFMTANSTTTVTLTWYNAAGTATNTGTSDDVYFQCWGN